MEWSKQECSDCSDNAGVYLILTIGGKTQKKASNIDPETVWVHLNTLENSRQNDYERGCYLPPASL